MLFSNLRKEEEMRLSWDEHWVTLNELEPEGSRSLFRKTSKKLCNRRGRSFSSFFKAAEYENLRSQSAAIAPPAHTLKITLT